MSKKTPPELRLVDVTTDDGSGCGFCLLNTMLMLAALVALTVKAVRR